MIVTDIKYRLSGGTSNTDPKLSLGGVISNTEVSTAKHGLFDYAKPEEAEIGSVKYRCVFVKNVHVSETLSDAVLYMSLETTSSYTTIDIAYDSTGTQSVVNENTAPSSPVLTFSKPTSKATGIALGNIAPGATKMIWERRTVTAGAVKLVGDTGQLMVVGGTAT